MQNSPHHDSSFHETLSEFIDSVMPSALPLEEKIKTFNALSDDETFERQLQHVIPKEDHQELKLPLYTYPQIHREIPRYFDDYGTIRIRPEFRCLLTLRKHLLDKALLYLYSEFPHTDPDVISIFTWVIPGGFGDYIAQSEIANLLQTNLPSARLQNITVIHEKEKDRFTPPMPTYFSLMKNNQEITSELITEESLHALRKSSLILQTPTHFPDTENLLSRVTLDHPNPPSYELLGEYGFINTNWAHPSSPGRCMGLHFLEKGILIKKPITAQFEEISNPVLKDLLVSGQFHFAYLITKRGAYLFFYGLLDAKKSDPKDIDFVVNDLKLFVDEANKGFPLAKRFNIKEIQIYFQKGMHPIPINEEGKIVRLIIPGSLCHDDFKRLMSLSLSPVVCRGDQSFSEAITTKNSLFYDAPDHAIPFLLDLHALAKNRLKEFPETIQYLKLFIPNEKENLSELIKPFSQLISSPRMHEGMQQLYGLLSKEYPINFTLIHIVLRALIHRKYPDIAKYEKKIVDEFCLGRLSFKKVMQTISKNLQERSL